MNNSIKPLLSAVITSAAIAGAVWQYGPCTFEAVPASSPPEPNAYVYFSKAAINLNLDEQKIKLPPALIARYYDTYPIGKSYSLYSVGPDEIDNNGSPISIGVAKDGYLKDTSRGDIVAGINL